MLLEQMEKACRRLIALDLSPPQFIILVEVSKVATSMSDLAESCGFTTSAATLAVDKLEKCGFVKRSHDKEDRRKIYVSITEKGRNQL